MDQIYNNKRKVSNLLLFEKAEKFILSSPEEGKKLRTEVLD